MKQSSPAITDLHRQDHSPAAKPFVVPQHISIGRKYTYLSKLGWVFTVAQAFSHCRTRGLLSSYSTWASLVSEQDLLIAVHGLLYL